MRSRLLAQTWELLEMKKLLERSLKPQWQKDGGKFRRRTILDQLLGIVEWSWAFLVRQEQKTTRLLGSGGYKCCEKMFEPWCKKACSMPHGELLPVTTFYRYHHGQHHYCHLHCLPWGWVNANKTKVNIPAVHLLYTLVMFTDGLQVQVQLTHSMGMFLPGSLKSFFSPMRMPWSSLSSPLHGWVNWIATINHQLTIS